MNVIFDEDELLYVWGGLGRKLRDECIHPKYMHTKKGVSSPGFYRFSSPNLVKEL